MGWRVDGPRDELVPAVGIGAAFGAHRTEKRIQEEERARYLPPSLVPGGRTPPRVGGKPRACAGHGLRHRNHRLRADPRFLRGELRRVARVELPQHFLERIERALALRMLMREILLPVPPPAHELPVVAAGLDQVVRDCEQERGFRTRLGGQPEIGVGRGVGKARVDHDQLRPARLPVHHPLRVWVEVVSGLEVRRDEEDHRGIGEIRARPIESHPVLIAGAAVRRADVGVRVVPVDTPGGKNALGIAVLAGPPDVVHDLVPPILLHGPPDSPGDVVERRVPRHLDPLPLAARPRPLEGLENPVRIGDLVEGRRSLGAVPAARARMLRIPFELPHLERLSVHVGEEPACRFAVEAGRGDERVVILHPPRPRLRVELHPVVPVLARRKRGEMDAARSGIEGLATALDLGAGGAQAAVDLLELLLFHARSPRREAPTGQPARRRAHGRRVR